MATSGKSTMMPVENGGGVELHQMETLWGLQPKVTRISPIASLMHEGTEWTAIHLDLPAVFRTS